jgi:hypothetical protein
VEALKMAAGEDHQEVVDPVAAMQVQVQAQRNQAITDADQHQEVLDPAAAADWGPWLNMGTVAAFGGLPQIMADYDRKVYGLDYDRQVEHYQNARDAWRQQHPYENVATTIGGAAPAAIGAAYATPEALGVETFGPWLGRFAPALFRTGASAIQGGATAGTEQPGDWTDKLLAGVKGGAFGAAGGAFGEAAGIIPGAIPGLGVASTVARATAGAGLGGLGGGAYGYYSSGGDWEKAAQDAVWGAGLTSGAAAGAPFISRGMQAVADAFYNSLHGRPAGMPAQAADALNTTLAYGGHTPDAAAAEVRNLGPGGVLADASPATQDVANQLAAKDKAVAPGMEADLTARAGQFEPNMRQALEGAVGPDFNEVDYLSKLKAQTRDKANAAYQPVLSQPTIVDASGVAAPVDAAKTAATAAKTTQGDVALALNKARGYLGADPTNLPIQQADVAIKEINGDMHAAYQAGRTDIGNGLRQLRDGLLNQMPPEYQAAHNGYADDKAIEDAFTSGRNIFASKLTPNQQAADLAAMSAPEREAYAKGASKAPYDLMGQAAKSGEAGVMRRLANETGYAAQKLEQVFGSDKANAVLQAIDNLEQMKTTNNLVLGGSKTARTQAASEAIPGFGREAPEKTAEKLIGYETGGELGEKIGSVIPGLGELGKQAGRVVGTTVGAYAQPFRAAAEESASQAREALARALTSAPPDELIRALVRRQGFADWGQKATAGMQAVARAMMTGGGVSGGQPAR